MATDDSGNIVFKGYDAITPDGDIAIVSKGKLSGVVDIHGTLLSPLIDGSIYPFDQSGHARSDLLDLYVSGESGRHGALDRRGQTVIAPIYESLDYISGPQRLIGRTAAGYVLLDTRGRKVVPTLYEDIEKPFGSDGLILWRVRNAQKYGAIDPVSGKLVISAIYDSFYRRGHYLIGEQEKNFDRLFTAFDDAGKLLVPAGDHHLEEWEANGLLVVDGHAIDASGQEVIPSGRFSSIRPTGDDAIVRTHGLAGLIDAKGAVRIAPQFDTLTALEEDPAGLLIFGKGDSDESRRYGLVDRNGRIVVPADWESFILLNAKGGDDRRYEVYRKEKYGILRVDGTTVLAADNDHIERIDREDEQRFLVSRDGLTGLFDIISGKSLIPMSFKALYPSDYSRDGQTVFKAQQVNGKWGAVDGMNRPILPLVYDEFVGDIDYRGFVVATRNGQSKRLDLSLADPESRSATNTRAVAQRYDGHPLSELLSVKIEKRYVAADFASEAQVLEAVRKGKLHDPVPISIQIAGRLAYVNFGEIANPLLPIMFNTQPVCETAKGFRLLTRHPDDDDAKISKACKTSSGIDKLDFVRTADGLACADCLAIGLPGTWLQRDPAAPPASCPIPTPFDAGKAQARYQEWLQRLKTALDARTGSTGQAAPLPEDVVEPRSRAASFFAGLLADPLAMHELGDDGEAARALFRSGLEGAIPIEWGGRYPEERPELPQCAQVWYVKMPALQALADRGDTFAGLTGFHLPKSGALERNAYPLLIFDFNSDGSLQLAGVSREFLSALIALKASKQ